MATGPDLGYHKVLLDEYRDNLADEFLEKSVTSDYKSSRWVHRYLISIMISILGLTTVIFVREFGTQQATAKPRNFDWTPCGNTSAEARANSCQFDLMLNAWVPEACHFADPADEYDASEFKWFLDKEKTQPIDETDFKTGNWPHRLYTDGSHHDQHCIYAWRKLSLAVERRVPLLDDRVASLHHSTHCAKNIRGALRDSLNGVDTYNGMASNSPLQFHGCVPLFV